MMLKYFGVTKIAAAIGEDCRLGLIYGETGSNPMTNSSFLPGPAQYLLFFGFVPRELRNLLSTVIMMMRSTGVSML